MDVSATEVLVRICGSAVLLLWGARMVRTGFMRAFGAEVRSLLAAGGQNRFLAAANGFAAAALLQSSTAVALLSGSFAITGLMPVAMGLAIMLGADLGSASLTQIFAFNIKEAWPLLFGIGYALHSYYYDRKIRGKQFGRICMGLGLIFLSLSLLTTAADAISQSQVVADVLGSLSQEPILAVVIVALLTWFTHSSLAVLLLIITLVQGGAITEPRLILILVLGANAGGALPAFFMTLHDKPPGRRIAVGNLIFRFSGVAICLLLLDRLAGLGGFFELDLSQQAVLFHIGFNAGLVALFLGAVGLVAWLTQRIVPDQIGPDDETRPRYLDDSAKEMPSVALSLAARETLRMVDIVEEMLHRAFAALQTNNLQTCQEVVDMDDELDRLYDAIKLYVTDLTRMQLEKEEGERSFQIISFATNLENIGDVIEKSVIDTVRKKIKDQKSFTDEGQAELRRLYNYVSETIKLASNVFLERDLVNARTLLVRKDEFREMELLNTDAHLERLRSGEAKSIETSGIHLDILRDLKRINSHFSSAAYPILDAAGELRTSRLIQRNSTDA